MTSPSWVALAFLLVMALPQVTPSDLQACSIPSNFSVMISQEREANIMGAELWTLINEENIAYYTYSNRQEMSITLDDAFAVFRGKMIIEYLEDGFESKPVRISRMYESRATGTAKLTRGADGINDQQECQLSLDPNNNLRKGVPTVVETAIRRFIETCLGAQLCQMITAVTSNNDPTPIDQEIVSLKRNPNSLKIEENEVNSISHQQYIRSPDTEIRSDATQRTINTLVDIALAEIIERMKRSNGGVINVPNIYEDFSKGSGFFKLHGRFEAINGTFGDLTTLKRTEDAVLTHSGEKFTASCGFGLSVTHLQYDIYKLRLALIRVSGKLEADIDGMAMDARVSVDYSQKPCTKNLEELRVTRLGNARIKITGLGPLNHLASKLLSWVTKKWRSEIVSKIKDKLTTAALKELDKFNCEKYRP